MSEPKFYTVFEADSAYLKALGDTNTYFSEFEVRLKTLEALGGKIDDSITSLLEVEKKILETVGGIATTTNDIFELRKEIAKAQGLDVSEDFNIWDVAQQEPPVGPKIFIIRFLNWDGTVLETVEVEEGQTPVYGGTEPTKESDETYDYTFNGWLPEISPANGNVDYVAQFTAVEIPQEDPADDITLPYVTFRAEEAGSTIEAVTGRVFEYSKDKTNWSWLVYAPTITLENIGDEVYIRGQRSQNQEKIGQFKMTGKIAAYGNGIMLWNYKGTVNDYRYAGYQLFKDCTALTRAPRLPLSTVPMGCCYEMFRGCTSLVEPPRDFEPTSIEYNSSYRNEGGCRGMFNSCTSLTKSPIIRDTNLKGGSGDGLSYCDYMFYNCTSLKEITCLATTITGGSNNYGCLWWVSGVPSGGTFYKAPSMTSWPTGGSGIPSGWTVVDYAG